MRRDPVLRLLEDVRRTAHLVLGLLEEVHQLLGALSLDDDLDLSPLGPRLDADPTLVRGHRL